MIGKFVRSIYRLFRLNVLQNLIPKSQQDLKLSKDCVIEVVGFFETHSGIGESARLCALSLIDSGFKVKCFSVESVFKKKPAFEWSNENFYSGEQLPSIRVFHLNPPMMPPAIFSIGFSNYKKSFNIGYWAWELEDIPREWKKALRYINGVMTPSSFTTKAIQKNTNKPVITVHHPISYNLAQINDGLRRKLKIDESTFLISTIFSFGSALERKNPESLIACFKKAFIQNEDVKLILKSNSGSVSEKSEILDLIKNDDRIVLIDHTWDRAEILGLIKESNLYASFHRSEGFGLTIAESLSLNTSVIVTNWSGNLDFCKSDKCYMVDYNMVPVRSKHPEFKDSANLQWAQIKESDAIDLLKRAYKIEVLKQTEEPFQIQSLIENDVYYKGLRQMEKQTTQNA